MEAGGDRRHRLAKVTYANPSSEVAPRQPLLILIGLDATRASKATIAITSTSLYVGFFLCRRGRCSTMNYSLNTFKSKCRGVFKYDNIISCSKYDNKHKKTC